MAKQRYVNTKFWSDGFISELNPLDRYLFLYFLTNEHTNICGIYEVPLKTIAFETGIELDMLKKMLKRLSGKVYYLDGFVYIKNFIKHQALNESIKKGIEVSKETIPKEILEKISKIEQEGDSLSPDTPQAPTYLNTNTNTNINSNIPEVNSGGVVSIIKQFEKINPAIKKMYGNKTQRLACIDLMEEYGLERVLSVIEKTLPKTNNLQYFPSITTPIQLRDKWASLESAITKYQSKTLVDKNKYPKI